MREHAELIRGRAERGSGCGPAVRAAFAELMLDRIDTPPGRCGVAIVGRISIVERAK
jgi:hypothetical protein